MGLNSNIQWTKHTWNPVQGCHKISEGCKNCYMFSDKKRYGQDGNNVHRSADKTFNLPLSWHKDIKPDTPMLDRLVFTASWSDWFIEENDPFRADMWQIVRDTPNLIYQILTKRADRIKDCLPSDWGNGYENVWLGVSCENQKRADERIPLLLETPAAIRFLSCEPLLEEIKFKQIPYAFDVWQNPLTGELTITDGRSVLDEKNQIVFKNEIDWVIVGGESGNGARPCSIEWIHSIVQQCKSADVACFVKQLGSNVTANYYDNYARDYTEEKGFDWECVNWDLRDGQPPMDTQARFPTKNKGGLIEDFPEGLQIRQMPV